MNPLGIHTRGYLPHWDLPGTTQALTYRLADALPAEVLDRLIRETPCRPDGSPDQLARRHRIEAWLDSGHGSCVLTRPDIAPVIRDAWRHGTGTDYELIAWAIMPNHVHLVIRLRPERSLGTVVRSWKSWTARHINTALGQQGQVWQEDYWDRMIRDDEHLWSTIRYIEHNPVAAGLAAEPGAWPWSSATR
jgi:putative transposase